MQVELQGAVFARRLASNDRLRRFNAWKQTQTLLSSPSNAGFIRWSYTPTQPLAFFPRKLYLRRSGRFARSIPMPHPSQPATAEPADPPPAKKPRGNPRLHHAPNCGARTRSGCAGRSPAIHGKLRCRMHGGRSTGPRTPKSLPRRRPGASTTCAPPTPPTATPAPRHAPKPATGSP
jgi:hypothetical protein